MAGVEVEVEAEGEEVRASNLVGLGEAAHMAGLGMVEVVRSDNRQVHMAEGHMEDCMLTALDGHVFAVAPASSSSTCQRPTS